MSRYFSNLIALSTHEEEVPQEVVNTKLASAVEKALSKHREEKEAAAAEEILEALRMVEEQKQNSRREIKRLRSSMKTLTEKLDELDRSMAYGQATSNFLPLLRTLGAVGIHSTGLDAKEFERLSNVPDGWKPAQ